MLPEKLWRKGTCRTDKRNAYAWLDDAVALDHAIAATLSLGRLSG